MSDQEKPSSRLGLASDIFTVIQFLAPILAGLIARLCKASLYLSIGIGVVVFLLLLFTLIYAPLVPPSHLRPAFGLPPKFHHFQK